jgi:hypothetical protein
MIDSVLTSYLHRRLRTDSAGLLFKTGNPPISHFVMASTRPHICLQTDQIKASDPHRNHRQRVKPRNNPSNPHSTITTTELISPRPRGFLP